MNQSIKILREEYSLTQEQFGLLFGYKRTQIQDIERGKVKVSAELAYRIIERYKVPLKWVLYADKPYADAKTRRIELITTEINNAIAAKKILSGGVPSYAIQRCIDFFLYGEDEVVTWRVYQIFSKKYGSVL